MLAQKRNDDEKRSANGNDSHSPPGGIPRVPRPLGRVEWGPHGRRELNLVAMVNRS